MSLKPTFSPRVKAFLSIPKNAQEVSKFAKDTSEQTVVYDVDGKPHTITKKSVWK